MEFRRLLAVNRFARWWPAASLGWMVCVWDACDTSGRDCPLVVSELQSEVEEASQVDGRGAH